jgi:hypothetical protein
MNRKALFMLIVVPLLGLGFLMPVTHYDSDLFKGPENPYLTRSTPSGIGDNFEDFIDSLSDLHSPSDIGTHDVFSDLQDFGLNYDQMTEADTGSAGYNLEDYVDQQSNLHAPSDIGTHSTFAEEQDHDSVFDLLTEANTAGVGTNEYRYVDTYSDVSWNEVGTTPYLAAQDQPTNYIWVAATGAQTGWCTIADTSGSGSGFTVNMTVYHNSATDSYIGWELDWTGDDVADASGSFTTSWTWAWESAGTITGLDTATEINACRVRFTHNKGTAGPDRLDIDAVRLGIYQAITPNYELDLEVGWTAAQYLEANEYLCVYGGTQGAEALRVDIWNGAWTNVIADLASGWNNVSVSSYLTSSSFEIRFADSGGDSSAQDTWQIDGVLLHVWTAGFTNYELDLEVGWTTADYDEQNEELCIYPVTGGGWPSEDIKVDVWNGAWTNIIADLMPDQWNNVSYAPANDQAPTLDNPTDTDNMYAQYQEYQVTVYVSDQNGFADIAYLEIGFWNDSQTTEYCRFRYDEDTNSFTEVFDGGTYVSLNTGSSSAVESGNDINATFYFTIDWDFPDSTDLDARCYVVDTQTESATTWYEVNWDVETRLDYSGSLNIDDGSGTPNRGNLGGSFSLTGTIIYYNSVDDYPLSSAVDVWVSAAGIGDWSDTTLTSGAFDVTCSANSSVSTAPGDTYTIKIVEEGAGSTGSDLFYTTSATETYIADQLVITITNPTDSRINVGENATGVFVSAIYDYDDTAFDGVLTLNDTTFDYGSVGRRGYTVTSATGGAHGVSYIGVNDITYCVWDSLTITITDPTNPRINVNTNASGIVVTAVYDYDLTLFDGTLTLNNSQFVYSTAQIQYYTVQSASGDSYSITTISTNDVTYCIWDSLTVTITGPTDDRININTNASGIVVSAVYDYDSTAFDGTLTLNNTQFVYSTAQIQWYTVQSVSGGTHGITAISVNDETYCIWDSLTIVITDPSEQRININTNASGILVSATYDYDGTTFDGLLTLNNTQFTYSTAQKQGYTVLSVSGGIHGITTISVNDVTYCIWDSLTITIIDPSEQRININANASGIVMSAIYDYDGTTFDGALTLNSSQFVYTTAQRQGYTVQSVSGGAYGITAISINDVTYCIWDSLTVTITDPSDQRININANASGMIVTAVYDYDGAAFDGALSLNNTQYGYGTAQIQWYTVNAVSGGSHGITSISTNDATYCIWDSLTITINGPTDQRININTNATGMIVTAIYDYDGSVFDGTLTLNNTQYAYGMAQIQWYTVDSVSGGAHVITEISTNDVTYCIWDSLTITITDPSEQRININSNASGIIITAIYDYDGSVFSGTFALNNTQFTYNSAQIQWYTVDSVVDGAFGISAISVNDATYCIWDSLTVAIIDPSDQRVNINTNASGIVVSAVYDYDGSTFDGTLVLNNTQFSYGTAQIQWYTVDSVVDGAFGISAISVNDATYCIWDSLTITITDPSDQRVNINTNASGIVVSAVYDYDGSAFDGALGLNNTQFSYGSAQIQWYTVDSVSGGAYVIIAISTNDATYCIWDSLTIAITDPSDQRVNINTNASGIVVSAVYDYDGSTFDGTLVLNNTQFSYGSAQIQWYTVDSVSGGDHIITAISTNDVTYCIWDQLVITIGVDGLTPLNGIQANFSLTVIYDYDNTACTTYQLVIQRNGTWWHSFTETNESSFVDTNIDTAYTYTVRLITSESTYSILSFSTNSVQVVWSAAPNNAPVNDAEPILVNPDDSTYMYARYKYYVITSNVSDADGYADIVYVELTLYDDSRTTAVWTVRYTVAGGTFSIPLGSDYISLSASSSASMSGSDLDITWYIKINWTHSILTNTDVKQYAYDGTNGVEDFYESNWDIETRLEIIGLTIDDGSGTGDRGPLDGSYFATGTIVYLGSVDNYPLSNETDVWISAPEYGINTGPWNDFVLVSGQFNITAYADDQVGLDTITIKVVTEGAGVGGTDLLSATTQSSYITDRILVQVYSAADDRINIGDTAIIDVEIVYQYDSSFVIDGTVIVNGLSATHQGSGVWRFTDSESIVTMNTYDSVVYSGGTHGLIQVNQNAMSQEVIWDQIVVQTTVADNDHVNIGDSVEIQVTLWLAYSSSPLGSGDTVILNGTAMTWDAGNSRFELVVSLSSVGRWVFSVNSSTESTYGITQVDTNSQSVAVIWDQIVVQTTAATDSRVDIGSTTTISVTLWLAYNHEFLGAGDSVTIDGSLMSWNGSLSQWEYEVSQFSVGKWSYFVNSSLESTSGITAMATNGQNVEVIWDQIVVQTTIANDTRVNIDGTVEIRVTLWLAYDLTPLGSGDTVTLDGTLMTWDGTNTWFGLEVSQSSVGAWLYFVNSTSQSAFSITAFDLNSQSVSIIWDRIAVQTTTVDDNRVDVGSGVEIRVTLMLEYDKTYLGPADSVVLAGSTMTWDAGNSRFEFLATQLNVGEWTYFVNSTQQNGYGITAVNLNGTSVNIIWDRIKVQSYSAIDTHVDIGDVVDIDVALRYEFDNTPVNSGTVSVNGMSAVSQGAGVWRISDSESLVGMNTYNLVACLNNIYNISIVNQNGQSISIVWDRLVVLIGVDDPSLLNDHQANFTLTVTFDYDDSVCSTYQLAIDRDAVWWHSFVLANVSSFVDVGSDTSHNYTARVISAESTYGITAFTTNTLIVTWSISPNEVPTNDGAPNLTNGDDVDYLYARYRFYVIITSASDSDGYANISYVELSLYSNDQSTLYWTVRYILGTNTFSVEVGGSDITIGSMSAAVGAGDTLTITWYLKIGWDHDDIIDSDVEQFVTDGLASDSDFYESNWNVETRLDYSTAPSLSDDRGNVNTADLVGTGSVTYYGSSLSPLANETDMWAIHDVSGTWSGDLSAGSFSISNIGSSASVRLNTYTFKIVAEGAGFGGADLYASTSLTDTFITDRIQIYEAGVVDTRIDIGSNCEVWWKARYEYDGTAIQSALVITLNGTQILSWSPGGSYWMLQESYSTPQSAGFAVGSASETAYGITVWIISTSAQQVIWDRVLLVSLSATSLSQDIGTATEIRAALVYEYDNAPVTDGSVFLDDDGTSVAMSYDISEGYWKSSITKNTAGSYTFTIASVSANEHGITSLNLNGLSVGIEWIGTPPILPDTMTLMLVGGGIGIALLGVAIIAMRRRGTSAPAGLVETAPTDLETPVAPEEAEIAESVSEEPEVPSSAEEIEPEEAPLVETEIEPTPADTEAAVEMTEAEEASIVKSEVAVQEEPLDTLPETELEALEDVEAVPEEVVSEIEVEVEPEAPEEIAEPTSPLESLSDESLTKDDLLNRLPPEVRDAIPEEDLAKMTRKEAKSLVESYSPPAVPLPEPEPGTMPAALGVEELSKLDKKVLIELLPQDIRETISPRELRRLSKKELISLLESFMEHEG